MGSRRSPETLAEKIDEVALMPDKGELKLTGQLGDVMKESAQAAYSYVRSRWKQLGLAVA